MDFSGIMGKLVILVFLCIQKSTRLNFKKLQSFVDIPLFTNLRQEQPIHNIYKIGAVANFSFDPEWEP